MANEKKEEKVKQILEIVDMMINDTAMPKNIRAAVENAKIRLNEPGEPDVRVGGAIYCLNEVSEDINLSAHARTQIWSILSALETVKEIQG